ncbi:MAG TPA: endonuclease III [Phycisphaerae bacterium]|nr:endonuclease III [Phycisphaerae bacterium]
MAGQRESREDLAARAADVARRLVAEYPDAACRLNFANPFELLVATILAAQCTDDKVNQVTPALFARAAMPEQLARLRPASIEKMIHSTGFFRNKAKSLKAASAMLVKEFAGRVPREMDDLLRLPGVARKTANVVRAVAFGLPAIITDTHVIRLAQRMGLSANKQPEKMERDLSALVPEEDWSAFSHAMLFHGRAVCDAKRPACQRCVVQDRCPSAFAFPRFPMPGASKVPVTRDMR